MELSRLQASALPARQLATGDYYTPQTWGLKGKNEGALS